MVPTITWATPTAYAIIFIQIFVPAVFVVIIVQFGHGLALEAGEKVGVGTEIRTFEVLI